jgi:hypothetical protein
MKGTKPEERKREGRRRARKGEKRREAISPAAIEGAAVATVALDPITRLPAGDGSDEVGFEPTSRGRGTRGAPDEW